MAGHLLGVLEPSIVLQVNRDAGRPPGVTSDGGEKTRRLGPLPNNDSSNHFEQLVASALQFGQLPAITCPGVIPYDALVSSEAQIKCLAFVLTNAGFLERRARSARFRLCVCVGILRCGKESNRVGKRAYEHFPVAA
jgi:hypothetical protein